MPIVVCIPGAAESERTFRDLTPLWPNGVQPIFHNIGILINRPVPDNYSWQMEIDALARRLDAFAGEAVYLLGISGGATLALSYIAERPEAVAGVGLIEPAWSFLPLSDEEKRYYEQLEQVLQLPPALQRDAFVRLLVKPDVELPEVSSTARLGYERARRPEETPLAIGTRAMQAHRVDATCLRGFRGPVYLAIGARSSSMWRAQAMQIRTALPQAVLEVYEDRHHLDAPHHAEAIRLRTGLVSAWRLNE